MITDPRLLTDRNLWVATVRPDGRPHLVPIWFVWLNERAYICTAARSVKVRNLTNNPHASIALEDGNRVLIAECAAQIFRRPYPDDVVQAFQEKYAWNIQTDDNYDALVELAPEKWLRWTAG